MTISDHLKKGSLAAKIAVAVIGTLIFLVVLENLTRIAIKAGLISYQQPMITQLPPGTEDWRKAHMTADKLRQPDPLLWWRPREGPPYNEQGFKGPVVENPKTANTIRILVYGDSNTEGTPEDSWPARLQIVLNRRTDRKYEVLNAGVAGYTSHQGLLRFQQEIGTYEPDIVLVAFGWNDLATATRPDRSYQPPSSFLISSERLLLKLRSYWTLKQMFTPKAGASPKTVSRVSMDDYAENLARFVTLGKQHNAKVVLITRPHRESNDELRKLDPDYRSRVPDYNQRLLQICREQGANCIDSETYFLESPKSEYWGDECHFTEIGRIEMAEFVSRQLAQLNLL